MRYGQGPFLADLDPQHCPERAGLIKLTAAIKKDSRGLWFVIE